MHIEKNIFKRGLPSGLYFLRQKVLLTDRCKIRLFPSFERVLPSVSSPHGGSEWAQCIGVDGLLLFVDLWLGWFEP